MNADVEKAVERMDAAFTMSSVIAHGDDWLTVRQALRDQEVEIAEQCRINGMGAERELALVGKVPSLERRAEKAESLLRECRLFVAWASEQLPEAMPTYDRITAHLGGENNG